MHKLYLAAKIRPVSCRRWRPNSRGINLKILDHRYGIPHNSVRGSEFYKQMHQNLETEASQEPHIIHKQRHQEEKFQ